MNSELPFTADDVLSAATGFAYITADRNGTINFFSQGACNLTGYAQEEIIGCHIAVLWPPEEVEQNLNLLKVGMGKGTITSDPALKQAFQSGGVKLSKNIVCRNGQRKKISISLSSLVKEGKLVGGLGVLEALPESHENNLGSEYLDNRFHLAGFIEALPENLFIFDIQNQRTIFTSNHVFKMLGYSPVQVSQMGENVLEKLIHPEDTQRQAEGMGALTQLSDKDVVIEESRMMHADGKYRTIRSKICIYRRDEDGNVISIIGIAADVTAEKKAFADLQESNTRFEMVAKASNSGIMDVNLITNEVYLSNRWRQIYNYFEKELVMEAFQSMIHPDDLKDYNESVKKMMEGEEFYQKMEFRIRLDDGSYRWVERNASILRDHTGKPIRYVGSSTNITYRKERELIIRRQNRLLESMAENLEVFMVWTDPAGNISEIKGRGLEKLGLETLNNPGTNIKALLPLFPSYAAKALLTGSCEFDSEGSHKGEKWWLRTYLLYVEGGQLTALSINITDTRVNEQKLIDARAAADAANRAKSEFLANMSHEIRTPLNGILGFTELLTGTDLTEEQRDYVKTITFSSDTLLNLIEEILDFSRIEAGRLTLENRRFNIFEEAEGIKKMFGPRVKDKNLSLDLVIAPDVPEYLVGDSHRIRQILVNMIGNAVKFTSAGGVNIEVKAAQTSNSCLEFRVSDTGIGIAPEKLESIFRPFVQAEGSTTRTFGGTGLGLTISRKLAQMMGGNLSVISTIGKGSTFILTVCLNSAEPVTDKAGAFKLPSPNNKPELPLPINNPGAGKSLNILVADDNPINNKLAVKMLSRLGHTVTTVENGMEAFKEFQTGRFNLVLMDVQMPVMDGLEATRQVRIFEQLNDLGHIPIIAMTANAMPGDREACINSGMEGYISKPLSLASIKDELGRVLPEAAGGQLMDSISV
ncbi:MAG: PAS domain-containing protein [Bacteroidota bacterium]